MLTKRKALIYGISVAAPLAVGLTASTVAFGYYLHDWQFYAIQALGIALTNLILDGELR